MLNWRMRSHTGACGRDKLSADKVEMSKHELDRAHLLSSLRVALEELNASPDAEQHYDDIWQLKRTLERWIVTLDAEARSEVIARQCQ
jgi:hypothetical protein